jgi:hypothetical protein
MTEEEVLALIDANLPDNDGRRISPFKHRQVEYALLAYSKACCSGHKKFDVTVTAAEIAAGSTIDIIDAQGANKYIRVMQLDLIAPYNGSTWNAPYYFRYSTGTLIVPTMTISDTYDLYKQQTLIDGIEYPLNDSVQFVPTFTATGGGGDVRLVGYYSVIDVS